MGNVLNSAAPANQFIESTEVIIPGEDLGLITYLGWEKPIHGEDMIP